MLFLPAMCYPEKTAHILRRHQRFPREMTCERRAQEFHNDDALLPSSGMCFWLVAATFTSGTTNPKHYPDLGSDTSSVWNFCARRRTFNYVSGIWIPYLHRKRQCKILIGRDDISNDVITLGSCFSMFVYIRACFRFTLIGGNLTAQSTGSHRWIVGGIQIPEM